MEMRDELVKKVTHLVSLPEIYWRIQELVNKPNASLKEFAAIVEKDPGTTAKVLGIANSAFYGFPTRIDTVSRAVNIMGIAQLHDLILATSVIRTFHGIPSELVDMPTYWQHSIYCALVAKGLAEKCRILDTERVFVQGLLRDIGHLVLYLMLPERMREVLELAQQRSEPVHLVERSVLGFDYGEVGGALMRAWKLPISLQETATFHIEPSKAQEYPLETALIHLAWLFALADETADKPATRPPEDPKAWQLTELTRPDVEAVLTQAQQSLQESLNLFMPASGKRGSKT